DDRVGRAVGQPPEVADRIRGEPLDVSLLAADLAAEGTVTEHRRLEQDLAALGWVVEVRADLLDDHGALAPDVGVVELRADDQLPDHVHAPGHLRARDAHPVHGRLAVRRGIERPADALDRLADRARRGVRLRALERQVLHEMGDTDFAGSLEPGAGEHVRRDRYRAGAGESGADHAWAGGQRRPFEHPSDGTGSATAALPHERAPSRMKGVRARTRADYPSGRPSRPGTVRPVTDTRPRARCHRSEAPSRTLSRRSTHG